MIPIIPISVSIPNVHFYSQFVDITSAKWKKVGCGVTSLAMIVDYYKPNMVSVDNLLALGVANNAYDYNAGWTYKGLIDLAKRYGLEGQTYELSRLTNTKAIDEFKNKLKDGPVIASVHYNFNPKSTIPHLVVIDGIKGDTLYYNDPAAKFGMKEISVSDFQKGWKKRFIVIRPVKKLMADSLIYIS